ncbi:hypothetical protein BH10PLA1_BH10PLA1_01070 [soil metagenome]
MGENCKNQVVIPATLSQTAGIKTQNSVDDWSCGGDSISLPYIANCIANGPKNMNCKIFLFLVVVAATINARAANPIVTDVFTADPAALVHGDTVYLYTGHDEAPPNNGYTMKEWLVFSTKDMKSWTSHGSPLSIKDFAWAKADAWAGQCIEKNGKFFWFVPVIAQDRNMRSIGIAVGDSPTGPFKDAIGKPLITDDMTPSNQRGDDIDPAVFIDDDGTPYLYWGNTNCYYAKLKQNMTELDGPINHVELKNYTEAPWVHKRGSVFYLSYSTGFPEKTAYATSDKPTGPWNYRGLIAEVAGNSNTIHQAIIEFKGQWYFIYHNGSMPAPNIGGSYRRSVCVDYLYYNSDGTIKRVSQTTEGTDIPPVPAKPNGNATSGNDSISTEINLEARGESMKRQPFHSWAPTPPMGWNSWDCFGTAVTEAQTKENTDYMAEKLLKHGWRLITVDIQWYEPSAHGHAYRKGAPVAMDPNGRLLPAVAKFPSAEGGQGFKSLADYVHAKGLTFGIHIMRGVPRQAVAQKLPILGTKYTAADIANTNDTCDWNPDMFGVDMSKPGAQAYYDSVFALIASWGVDFVKVDDLSRPYADHKKEIEAIRSAIDKTGRPMVLSMSPGETPLEVAEHVGDHANLWRISDDFWDKWELLHKQFARCKNWAKYQSPGCYPDADMLALGAVRIGQKNPWTRFTADEQLTHMTLWSIARSPLIFGGHLPLNDEWTLSLLTNDEVIAVNQEGRNQRELSNDDGLITWVSDVPDSNNKYVAVFNTRGPKVGGQVKGLTVPIRFDRLGMPRACKVRDLWKKEDLGECDTEFVPLVPSHGCRLLRISPLPG